MQACAAARRGAGLLEVEELHHVVLHDLQHRAASALGSMIESTASTRAIEYRRERMPPSFAVSSCVQPMADANSQRGSASMRTCARWRAAVRRHAASGRFGSSDAARALPSAFISFAQAVITLRARRRC